MQGYGMSAISVKTNGCISSTEHCFLLLIPHFNVLKPNVNYSGRTAPLTSKVAFYIFIQQI